MNKQRFMEELEVLLSTIPQVEREEALGYYANYFEDAGEEKESEVLEELGTPEKVAKIIFDEIGQADIDEIDKTEVQENQKKNVIESTDATKVPKEKIETKRKMGKARKIIMICTSPIWAPILFAIWIVLISLIISMSVVAFSIAIVVLVCVIVGIAAIVDGVIHMFIIPTYGLCLIGAGLVTVAVGILMLLLVLLLILVIIPGLSKSFALSYTLPFKVKGEK